MSLRSEVRNQTSEEQKKTITSTRIWNAYKDDFLREMRNIFNDPLRGKLLHGKSIINQHSIALIFNTLYLNSQNVHFFIVLRSSETITIQIIRRTRAFYSAIHIQIKTYCSLVRRLFTLCS